MSTAKSFHLGDLVTVVTGRLVSPNHINGANDVCGFVTGEQHMTHQLLRASKTVTPWLLEHLPWLADITVPEFDIPSGASREDAMRIIGDWLAGPVSRYGEWHDVTPMPFGAYVGRDPIAELQEMAPHAQIIAVEVDPDGGAS
jgi:hypothetical protein